MSWNHIGLLFFPSVTQRSMADGKWKIFPFFFLFLHGVRKNDFVNTDFEDS
jgi:hypothetical protein